MIGKALAVLADDYLLRRIHPSEVYSSPDGGPSRPFASSFKSPHRGDPLSVYVQRLLEAAGLDARALLVGHESYRVVGVAIAAVRDLGLDVQLDPDLDDELVGRGESHAVVLGTINKSRQNTLAKSCDRVIWEPTTDAQTAAAS